MAAFRILNTLSLDNYNCQSTNQFSNIETSTNCIKITKHGQRVLNN